MRCQQESAAWEAGPGSRTEAGPGSAVPSPGGALCNHGNTASEPSADSSDPARAATTSSRPGGVGDTPTWNDPHATLLRGGESSGKILENIRLWGPRGRKGLPAENNLVFGQKDSGWYLGSNSEPSPGPRRKNAMVSYGWVASWKKRQVTLKPRPEKAVGTGRP